MPLSYKIAHYMGLDSHRALDGLQGKEGNFRRGKLSDLGARSHEHMANNSTRWLHVNSFGPSSMELRRARPMTKRTKWWFENKLLRSPAGSCYDSRAGIRVSQRRVW